MSVMDERVDEARRAVIDTQSASILNLQRRLRINFMDAARLLDVLQQEGVVSDCATGARIVLVARPEPRA